MLDWTEMNDSVFAQAINETFPDLEPALREEIFQKVSGHMIEYLKERVFQNDPKGMLSLLSELTPETNHDYVKKIMEKFFSLPEETQITINKEFDSEMTRVMHQVYQACTE